ncbi:MAG: phosphatase PAP2 family protein [Candidatus Nanoarchaeia archaeon]|nr:phosphatase PAP2 family protein [Candidatus Nanoarchaeia archaeon]
MKTVYYGLLGLILLAFSFFLDSAVFGFVKAIRNPFLDSAMKGFYFIGAQLVVLAVLTFVLYYNRPTRKWIIPWWITWITSLAVTFVLKFLIERIRPEIITALIPETGFAFPSGHATAAFASVPLVNKIFKKTKLFWIVYVVLIGFSRIYLGVHYFSDVIAGALVGIICGKIILKLSKK